MAREKRIKEIRKSYAIIGEGITEFFYFDGYDINNPHTSYSRVFEVFEELLQKR